MGFRTAAAHDGLDEGGTLALHLHQIPVGLEQDAICLPARGHRRGRIMEEVDIPGDPRGSDNGVQRHAAGHVALTAFQAVAGDQAADAALEFFKSHCLRTAAFRKAVASPCCSMDSSTRQASMGVRG